MALSCGSMASRSTSCRLSGSSLTAPVRPRTCIRSRQQTRVLALFGGGGGGGGGGNPFDMKNLMESVKKAQQMVQVETAKVQQELAETEFEGYDEDETVRVVMSGNQEPRSVDVTEAALQAGAEELSRRLTLAMKDAHGKSTAGMKDKMKELARNLGIPNPGQIPGM